MAIDPALDIAGRLLRRLAVPAPPGIPRQREVVAHLATLLPKWWEWLA